MEAFDLSVVKQQNRALVCALRDKDRRIKELRDAVHTKDKAERSTSALVSCVDRHWRQLEADAALLIKALSQTPSVYVKPEETDGEGATAIHHVLLEGVNWYLLSDLGKFADSLAVDPLDEVIRYDEPAMGLPGAVYADNEHTIATRVEESVAQRCGSVRGALHALMKRLQEVTATTSVDRMALPLPASGALVTAPSPSPLALPAAAAALPTSTSLSSSSSVAVGGVAPAGGGGSGAPPPASSSSSSSQPPPPPHPLANDLVESQRRLQAQLELYKDRLVQARRCQVNLYTGLVKLIKERHRLYRQLDGQYESEGEHTGGGESSAAEEASAGMDVDTDGERKVIKEEGVNGVHTHRPDSLLRTPSGRMTGHKRRRSETDSASPGPNRQASSTSEGASCEQLQEYKSLAEMRLEELEKLREEKAELNRRVNQLSIPPPPVPIATDEQIRQCMLYRHAVSECEQAQKERDDAIRSAQELTGLVQELQTQMDALRRAKQEEVESERAHWMPRAEDMTREIQALRRKLDELTLEVDSRRDLARQADEVKTLYEEQKSELQRTKEYSKKVSSEVNDLRKERQSLQSRLSSKDQQLEEMGRKRMEGLKPDADQRREARIRDLQQRLDEANAEKERMSAFQTSLFEETESLSAAHEELSQTVERLRQSVEEKERRNSVLMDDILRARHSEKMQQEKTSNVEKGMAKFDSLKTKQEELLRTLQEQLNKLQERVLVAERERAAAEEKMQSATKKAHESTRALEETSAKLRIEEQKATALTKRADELARQLDHAEQERSRLQEQLMTLNRKLQKAQSRCQKLESAAAAAQAAATQSGGEGAGGANGEHAHAGGSSTDMLKILNCSVCNVRWKDVIISKCWHMFCRECVQENLKVRSRKCPACGKGFGQDDVHDIYLT